MKTKTSALRMLPGWRWAGATLVACGLLLPSLATAEGTWVPLANQPSEGIGTMLLLPDGTVMAQGGGGGFVSSNWYRLTPDSNGSYVNGQWTSRQSTIYANLYYSSAVLKDGRVFMAGGEFGNASSTAEVYNPQSDSWTVLTVPTGLLGPGGFKDSASVLLANGSVLVTPVHPANPGGTVLFNPVSNTLSLGPTLTNIANEAEGGFVKLPDDSILVIDSGGTTSERYIPSLNQWVNDGTVPVSLYDPYGNELGPGLLLPNGKAFYIGSTSRTALYTPSGSSSPGNWIQGPNIPGGLGAPDAPAAMMFNGKILCVLSPTPFTAGGTNDVFTTPTFFYEFDYSTGSHGTFTEIHAPDGSFSINGPTYFDRMLDLPSGSVLFTYGDSQLYVYQPDGTPLPAGKPNIQSVSWNASGNSLHLKGTLLNGISQGAAYGDDAQMDSNYPLIRLTDGSGDVVYARSFNWSSSSVMTGTAVVSTEFTPPSDLPPGNYSLVAIANGIRSDAVAFNGPVWVDFNYSTNNVQTGTRQHPFGTLAGGVGDVASGGTIAINANVQPSASHETMTISKPMTIISENGPSTIGH